MSKTVILCCRCQHTVKLVAGLVIARCPNCGEAFTPEQIERLSGHSQAGDEPQAPPELPDGG